MTARVQVLLGTKKGAFILEGDQSRTNWHLRGPFCEAWPIHHLNVNAVTGTLYAASGNPWFGPSVWRSDDNAQTWTQSGAGLTYGDAGPTIDTMWHVTSAHGVLYAGAAPAGLFRSTDDGATWEHVILWLSTPTIHRSSTRFPSTVLIRAAMCLMGGWWCGAAEIAATPGPP